VDRERLHRLDVTELATEAPAGVEGKAASLRGSPG
jgi:hypothetical protein